MLKDVPHISAQCEQRGDPGIFVRVEHIKVGVRGQPIKFCLRQRFQLLRTRSAGPRLRGDDVSSLFVVRATAPRLLGIAATGRWRDNRATRCMRRGRAIRHTRMHAPCHAATLAHGLDVLRVPPALWCATGAAPARLSRGTARVARVRRGCAPGKAPRAPVPRHSTALSSRSCSQS